MDDDRRLKAEILYRDTDFGPLDFETTEDLETLDGVVGQPRAVDAIRFGIGIQQEGYNIFVLGPTGTGKRGFIAQFFEDQAADEPVPDDWCYLYNFDQPHKPMAIHLPAGMGVELHDDMEELVEEMRTALSAAFESDEYQSRRQAIVESFKDRQSEAFAELREHAREQDFALIRTPSGIALAPIRDGEVMPPEEIQALSDEERQTLEATSSELQEELQSIMRQVPSWQREMREELKELNREMTNLAIGGLIDELQEAYADHTKVVEYLDDVQQDVVEHADDFFAASDENSQQAQAVFGGGGGGGGRMQQMMGRGQQSEAFLRRYEVNVLVDHSEDEGAPVIYENNPTYQNLIGRVEHRAMMGALITDFTLIKPGALHRANGGYLILDMRKVLMQPYAWEALKRMLQSQKIRIESLGRRLSLISTISLEPEEIPLDVKVALFGERMLYYLLWQLDPEFAELFKVMADFEDRMDRDDDNQQIYARLLATLARKKDLRPLDRQAVARVIERSARMVGDAEKLSTQMRHVTDLLREANYWAEQADHDVITQGDVQQAIDAQIERVDRMRDRVHEAILRDTLLIDTQGEEVGQVNGLSVLALGNFAFGRPTRITARVRLGKGEVIDIEREVALGGPIHSKGVLILVGFLNGRYAVDHPLSLAASLVFEQSYGGIEGDSASSAELYALLSAIAEIPIRQGLAVTGSVNQQGRVQAIGGVNEKIEGFFDICQARGLTGEQGVLIPDSNVKHLMLRQDVVEAVAEGQFHVYAVETVDQGIEILTGVPAGERDEEGQYPEGSVNARVAQRLRALAEKRREFGVPEKEEGKA
jgi:lon-related putative ATP-dependent protease